MIQLLFAVRYQSQLRRVRPQIMATLEAEVARSIRDSGGVFRVDGAVLKARFDEEKLAFWLDLVVALEGIAAGLAAAAEDLYGHACIVYKDSGGPELQESALRRFSRTESDPGIWCDEHVAAALSAYASFDRTAKLPPGREENLPERLYPIASFKFPPSSAFSQIRGYENGLADSIKNLLTKSARGDMGSFALLGPTFRGKRSALRSAVAAHMDAFPPYFVRFGVGGTGLACLADAIDENILSVLDATGDGKDQAAGTDLLNAVGAVRLRAEPQAALTAEFTRYLEVFVDSYVSAARKRAVHPVFVLENVQKADALAAKVAAAVFGPHTAKKDAAIVLTVTKDDALRAWRDSALSVVQLVGPNEGPNGETIAGLSDDVLEYLYALILLYPLFAPRELLTQFMLEGKSPRSLEHALVVLSAAELIESPDDPEPSCPELASRIETRLGAKAERVRAFVRRRLLATVYAGKARPSFGLLAALSSFGGECDDELALDAVEAEAGDGTVIGLTRLFSSSRMRAVFGNRSLPLEYIARARCALRGSEHAVVKDLFAAPQPTWFPSPRYRAAVLSDLAAFHLGNRDISNAEARAKEAILLLQDRSDSRGLARAYRLLGLVELAKQRVSESIDYLTFAREASEKAAEDEESAVDAAYAAVAEYVWGNTAKAERLILSAELLAGHAHRTDWKRWSRFFRGRLRFEAGCYRDAAELFESVLASVDEDFGEDERRTVSSWQYRARMYNSVRPSSEMAGMEIEGDCGLFYLESLFFAADYSSSISVADKLLSAAASDQFSSPERPSWESGFSLVEDLVLPAGTSRRRLVRMIRALSIAARRNDAESVSQAAEELRLLVKEEKLSEADPFNALYYHAYCRALEAASAPAVDVGTALSVAFQRMQRRASRIDEAEAKRSYLYINRWNAELLAEAKRYNLI